MAGMVSSLLSIAAIFLMIYKLKERIKRLSIKQIVAIVISFILFVGVATFAIYYVGNNIVGQFSDGIIKEVIKYVIIIVVLLLSIIGFDKFLVKITASSQE